MCRQFAAWTSESHDSPNEIFSFQLRSDQLESGLSDFIILKNRRKKATGRPLDNDLLITLFTKKTTGPMQQHLRFNVRNTNTVMEIVSSYLNSGLLTVRSMSKEGGPADIDIGALKGKKPTRGGKGHIVWKRYVPRKRHTQRNVQRQEKEREKDAKEWEDKESVCVRRTITVGFFVLQSAAGFPQVISDYFLGRVRERFCFPKLAQKSIDLVDFALAIWTRALVANVG